MREPKTARRLDKRWKNALKPWSDEDLELLGSKYGLVKDITLARKLQRSPNAIKIAAVRKLHSNHKMNFYTGRALAQSLGVLDSKTLIRWADAGWIKVRRSVVRQGSFRAWRFLEKDIIQFLRTRPWLLNPKEMPEHYFRSIVREEYEKDPWYNCREAAPLLGVIDFNAVHRYIRRGWLPATKRPLIGKAGNGSWGYVIMRSAIDNFLANDPRPAHKAELHSLSKRNLRRKNGQPVRLSVVWSVICPSCGQAVVVRSEPDLLGFEVKELFTRIYTNGTCSHGNVCKLDFKRYQFKQIMSETNG